MNQNRSSSGSKQPDWMKGLPMTVTSNAENSVQPLNRIDQSSSSSSTNTIPSNKPQIASTDANHNVMPKVKPKISTSKTAGVQKNQKLSKKEKRKSANQQKRLQQQQQLQRMMAMASGSNELGDDPMQAIVNVKANPNQSVDDDNADDQLGVTETYADYMPKKLKIGAQHPDPVVETSTLSSIEPNDITYQLSIPNKCIEEKKLSALQLESIIYASQAHEKILPDGTRAGFLIGTNWFSSSLFQNFCSNIRFISFEPFFLQSSCT